MSQSTLVLLVVGGFACAVLFIILWLRSRNRQAASVIAASTLRTQLDTASQLINSHKTELENSLFRIEELKATVERLGPYQNIINAEHRSEEIVASAETEAGVIRASAQVIKAKADSVLKVKEQEADELLSRATRDSANIIADAKTEAQRIAGDAYKALEQRDKLSAIAEAMKNAVEGYGDRYLVPTHSQVDILAEEYGHTPKGDELKRARAQSRLMIEESTAAISDLAEPVRRTSAIRFVIDAFNGKVESVLTRAKNDNFGTLRQEIMDGFALINHDAEAFKTRVSSVYRDARIKELQLIVWLNALKEREKEEQRRIKEQMREEEKARRDYERAIKEAQKEEEQLKRAMDRARAEIAKASSEEREKYEVLLAALQEKLEDAESRNRRALSMAEQTRAGHVYIISNVGSLGEGVLKLGLTRRLDPMDRIAELGDASVPFEFDVHAMIYSEDAPALEKQLHRTFDQHRVNLVNLRKEFFKVSIEAVRNYLTAQGMQVQFTLLATAREYRESVVLSSMTPAEKAKHSIKLPIEETALSREN